MSPARSPFPPRPGCRTARALGCGVLVLALLLTPDAPSAAGVASSPSSRVRVAGADDPAWVWPLSGPRVVSRPFVAPPSRYEAGHRGIDLPAVPDTPVMAPVAGVVRFAGVVVDRPVVTVETRDGALVSVEPVSTGLRRGDAVERGAVMGTIAEGGHCSGTCLHLGVRVNGEYVSPMLFFGGVPRAVLLPLR